jgi:hypothetical protein
MSEILGNRSRSRMNCGGVAFSFSSQYWILELPEDLKRSFRDELEEYEMENQIPYPYVTSIASSTLRE